MTVLVRPQFCKYCLHVERLDLVWCGDFYACRNVKACDNRATERGLQFGEHIEGPIL